MTERINLYRGITIGELRKFLKEVDDSTKIFWWNDNDDEEIEDCVTSVNIEKDYWEMFKGHQINLNIYVDKKDPNYHFVLEI